jgi:hypothetical protein
MTSKLLPALTAVVMGLGCLTAQALPVDDPTLTHYSGVKSFTHKGNYAVDFIQGRVVPSGAHGVASAQENGAAKYASLNSSLTIVLIALAAGVMGLLALGGRPSRARARSEALPRDASRRTSVIWTA